eukprot:TRINITY_DN62922_c0_g1_i1.p1 TRINITY_DN62922_c0_g1~~TRINITY_DN62922_c0_g1_i1.p1  ORF type:complete len:408 (-),score=37.33 TRINITY_DN62922_c0_g1_i1:16-1239(-)
MTATMTDVRTNRFGRSLVLLLICLIAAASFFSSTMLSKKFGYIQLANFWDSFSVNGVRGASLPTEAGALAVSYHKVGETTLDEHDGASSDSDSGPIPLAVLVQSAQASSMSCPNGLTPILDSPLPTPQKQLNGQQAASGRASKIPPIIHLTSKSRCATPEVHRIVNRWREKFSSYALYFHDDAAVERLTSHALTKSAFPLLNETLKCVTSGATKSDLWRYLVLYLYGGIYTDIDNSPVLLNASTISRDDDSFFLIEQLGILSQYFFASSPKHPLMRLCLENALHRLRSTSNVMQNSPAKTTGPGALKVAFIDFLNGTTTGYIPAGLYYGLGDFNKHSVTAFGTKENSVKYVHRSGLRPNEKKKYYDALGMKHFSKVYKPVRGVAAISCMEHLRRTKGTNVVANYLAT